MVNVLKPDTDIEGVKDTVAQKVYKMLQSGRRYFGSSGALLTHQLNNTEFRDDELDRKYATEELDTVRKTTKLLQEWVSDKPNVVLVDSVLNPSLARLSPKRDYLNNKFENGILNDISVDHVLLAGNEVIFIDTKAWKKKKRYKTGDDGSFLMTDKKFVESDNREAEKIDEWLNYYPPGEATITTLVLINQQEVTVFRDRNWFTAQFRLVEIDRFHDLLNEKWEQHVSDENKNTINTTLVAQTIVRCIKPYDQFTKVFSNAALKDFR